MGTGGWRYRAGRPGWRRKCENMLSLDVRRMARKGYLAPGQAGSWQWSRGDEPAGSISYRAEADSVRLSYTWSPYNGDPVTMDYGVLLRRTPCHYGGTRLWFICPRCGDRRAVLYGIARDGHFGCRRCLRLGYASEAESVVDRSWRRQRKLEARLDCKGIHQRTTSRIMAKIEECEERRDIALVPGLARLLARLDPEFAATFRQELGDA